MTRKCHVRFGRGRLEKGREAPRQPPTSLYKLFKRLPQPNQYRQD